MRLRLVRALAWLLLWAWSGSTGVLVWLLLVFPAEKLSSSARDAPLYVPPGSSADALAALLARAKIVDNPRALALYLRALGADRTLRSGWVVVNRSLSVREQLPRIARAFGQTSVSVPVPEGFTSFDIATRLERYGVARRQAVLTAVRDKQLLARLGIEGDSAEGYLFPAQYGLAYDTPAERVVERMVATFRARTAELFARHTALENGAPTARLSARELVILASIVEHEARVPEERATIAGVFVNRLLDPDFRPRRLQADPTVAYGCLIDSLRIPSCREFDGRRITPAMVRDPQNAYSTYRHEGLPPGPICNPGLASLSAAIAPEPHRYLYFVAKGGGRHAFAASLEEHNRNIHPIAREADGP